MSHQSVFFVGGVRSGKSALALRWGEACATRCLYVATACADDAEMTARIARHKAQRGEKWECVEAPFDPVGGIQHRFSNGNGNPGVILLDCVSLWIANLLGQEMKEKAILERVTSLKALISACKTPFGVVSLEAGLGMVPISSIGRLYQDVLGLANQMLAQSCDTVIHVSCGLPVPLKGRIPEELCQD
ncbi:MAG: bifunctional adenosylcobinamide kinase/adenosylcobinamide-phosphate guanylyltransferase [Desulfovibrio sp.]|nr:bifunctional adenosylcobinamide kinase/adenosylcobinamide-phosphate guanylyltransferase [Desulfovibrio sp.]